MLWILNILDAIVGINIIGLHFGFLQTLALVSIAYLLIKGIIFIADPFSILDILMAGYMVLLLLGVKTVFTLVFVLYIAYKIVISLTY